MVGSMKTIGYARVSTEKSDGALQVDALRAAGCEEVFEDAAGGTRRDRPWLSEALAVVRAGDVLVVRRLDRLGRCVTCSKSSRKCATAASSLRSLTESVDTSTATGKLVYGILGSIAEFERDLIRERTVAGMRAARRRGVHCGRRRALTTSQGELAQLALMAPNVSITLVARHLRIGRATLCRGALNYRGVIRWGDDRLRIGARCAPVRSSYATYASRTFMGYF
jgi:DNA invertase Pin-like site-specific DNA recombinase